MANYIALLRGVNVSGKNFIRMAELQGSFLALGFTDVQTYLQSGNVVFNSGKSDEGKLANAIQKRITNDLGHDVPVLVISAKEFGDLADPNPLWPAARGDETLFHSSFLFHPVAPDSFKKLKLPVAEGERVVLTEKAVFLHCMN